MRRTALAALSLAFLGMALGACLHRPVEIQMADLEKQIDGQLPPGSSRQQVVSFLSDHRIEADYEAEKNEVFGKVEASRTLVTRTDLALFFVLDSSGRLASHHIERWISGP